MSKKKYKIFDWVPYLFGNEVPDEDQTEEIEKEDADTEKEEKNNKSKKKKRRAEINDENPVSFRTVTEPLTVQQIVYFIVRDLLYAIGPMLSYIWIAMLCIVIGYPLSGMTRYGFEVYLAERSNLMIAIAVIITLRYLYKKSKKRGSVFFEDASLYRKDIDWKKLLMAFIFGAGCALFLSSALTLVPKVWVFATYNTKATAVYQRYDILLTIIESAFLTPLVEEIIFRGYMLNRLLKRWNDLPALIVTTLVFSVMHGSSIWIIYAFVMGLIIGVVSMREGNILYGIFIHAGFNLPSVIQWFIYFVHPELQSTQAITEIFETVLLGVFGLIAAIAVYLFYNVRVKDGISTN